jgi:hypothetical protein
MLRGLTQPDQKARDPKRRVRVCASLCAGVRVWKTCPQLLDRECRSARASSRPAMSLPKKSSHAFRPRRRRGRKPRAKLPRQPPRSLSRLSSRQSNALPSRLRSGVRLSAAVLLAPAGSRANRPSADASVRRGSQLLPYRMFGRRQLKRPAWSVLLVRVRRLAFAVVTTSRPSAGLSSIHKRAAKAVEARLAIGGAVPRVRPRSLP